MRFSKDLWKPVSGFHGSGGVHGRPQSTAGLRRRLLASRGPGERERVGPMHQSVENHVGDGGIAQVIVPALARQLTGDHGRPRAIAVFKDLEQLPWMRVSAQCASQRSKPRRGRW